MSNPVSMGTGSRFFDLVPLVSSFAIVLTLESVAWRAAAGSALLTVAYYLGAVREARWWRNWFAEMLRRASDADAGR